MKNSTSNFSTPDSEQHEVDKGNTGGIINNSSPNTIPETNQEGNGKNTENTSEHEIMLSPDVEKKNSNTNSKVKVTSLTSDECDYKINTIKKCVLKCFNSSTPDLSNSKYDTFQDSENTIPETDQSKTIFCCNKTKKNENTASSFLNPVVNLNQATITKKDAEVIASAYTGRNSTDQSTKNLTPSEKGSKKELLGSNHRKTLFNSNLDSQDNNKWRQMEAKTINFMKKAPSKTAIDLDNEIECPTLISKNSSNEVITRGKRKKSLLDNGSFDNDCTETNRIKVHFQDMQNISDHDKILQKKPHIQGSKLCKKLEEKKSCRTNIFNTVNSGYIAKHRKASSPFHCRRKISLDMKNKNSCRSKKSSTPIIPCKLGKRKYNSSLESEDPIAKRPKISSFRWIGL